MNTAETTQLPPAVTGETLRTRAGLTRILLVLATITPALAVPGFLDLAYDPNADGMVVCLALQPDGKLLIGGRFGNVGGMPHNRIARLNSDGTADATFNANINEEVCAVAVAADGRILVAGTFTSVNGVPRNRVARLSTDGSLDMTFNPNVNVGVFGITEQSDAKILITGMFSTVGGGSRQGFARLKPDGSLDTTFNASLGWLVPAGASAHSALEQPNGKIIVGAGNFRSVGGVSRWGCARVAATGAVDGVFNPHLEPETCSSISLLPDGRIVLGGNFTSVGGTVRTRLALLSANGALDTGFIPELNSVVATTSLQTDGKLVIGGQFSSVSGVPRSNATRLNADGTLDTGFLLSPSSQVTCSAIQQDGKILIGGTFELVNGKTRNSIARLENNPATESLTIPTRAGVQWLRGGASPEVNLTTFDLSTDLGASWSRLGKGVRISGGWEITGLTLPPSGLVRARARSADSRQNGIFQTQAFFNLVPEMAVRLGTGTKTQEVLDGQVDPIGFGTHRQLSVPLPTLNYVISNTGTAPLIISAITLPDAYFLPDPPTLPVSIAENASLVLIVNLSTKMAGEFTGSIALENNDPDEATFDFPVAGTIIAPEIIVHDGIEVSAPEILDEQAASVEFGKHVQGTPGTMSFTIANIGMTDLLVSSVTAPAGYLVAGLPQVPFKVGIGAAQTFQMTLMTLTVGAHSGSVAIESDDLDESLFTFPISGEVFIPNPGSVVVSASTVLNPQTGLREQAIHVSNDTTATVPGYDLIIRGLPVEVEVFNASDVRVDGSVIVHIFQPIGPQTGQDIVLEYDSATDGAAVLNPQLSTEVVLNPPNQAVPGSTVTLAMHRVLILDGGDLLLEFTSLPGRLYRIQYSIDGLFWKDSSPRVRAAGNRLQWTDRGSPRTDSAPSQQASRFYRVKDESH